MYTLAKKQWGGLGGNGEKYDRIKSPSFGRAGDPEFCFRSPDAFNKPKGIVTYGATDYEGNLERAVEAAEAEEASNNGRVEQRGRGGASKPDGVRDETPDVLGPNRGVGNLLSKLIDGDGSYLYEDQPSLQNPAQLLGGGGQPKREIQKIIIRSVKNSEQDAATNGPSSGMPRKLSSKSNSRLLAQNNSALLDKEAPGSGQLLDDSKKSASALPPPSPAPKTAGASQKRQGTGAKSFKSFRSARSKERSKLSNTLSQNRLAAGLADQDNYNSDGPASPLFAGPVPSQYRAISPSATRPLDLSALGAHPQAVEHNLNKTMAAHRADTSQDDLAANMNKSQDVVARVPKKKKKTAALEKSQAKSVKRSTRSRDVSKKAVKKKLSNPLDLERKGQIEMRSSGDLAAQATTFVSNQKAAKKLSKNSSAGSHQQLLFSQHTAPHQEQ